MQENCKSWWIVISKKRVVEMENVDIVTIRERINVEDTNGRKEKITDYWHYKMKDQYII